MRLELLFWAAAALLVFAGVSAAGAPLVAAGRKWITLLGRNGCTLRGQLSGNLCTERSRALTLLSAGLGVRSTWRLALASGLAGPGGELVGKPVTLQLTGRATGCPAESYLSGAAACDNTSAYTSLRQSWVLESAGGDTSFYLRSSARGACGAKYLGALVACGAAGDDPRLGLYPKASPPDSSVQLVWALTPLQEPPPPSPPPRPPPRPRPPRPPPRPKPPTPPRPRPPSPRPPLPRPPPSPRPPKPPKPPSPRPPRPPPPPRPRPPKPPSPRPPPPSPRPPRPPPPNPRPPPLCDPLVQVPKSEVCQNESANPPYGPLECCWGLKCVLDIKRVAKRCASPPLPPAILDISANPQGPLAYTLVVTLEPTADAGGTDIGIFQYLATYEILDSDLPGGLSRVSGNASLLQLTFPDIPCGSTVNVTAISIQGSFPFTRSEYPSVALASTPACPEPPACVWDLALAFGPPTSLTVPPAPASDDACPSLTLDTPGLFACAATPALSVDGAGLALLADLACAGDGWPAVNSLRVAVQGPDDVGILIHSLQVGATGPGIQLDQDITWYLANTNNTNFLSTATFPAGTIPGGSSVAEAGLSQPLALHLGQPVELSLTATWDPGSEAGAWQALRVLSTQPVQA